ncbi:MAG TPA: glycosyltransferase family 39 protein [Candidatus Eremiobacteraceae bacterium]|nr:glycosyltransferase family 39 protein [Candidatus Eremiobacteraceae bacterium]
MAPEPSPASTARVAFGGLWIALALGAFLIFYQLAQQSVYVDEAFTLDAARMPIGAMLAQLAQHDAHPPLLYLYVHAAMSLLHWPSTWYRYLVAPFGLVTIACTWALARRAFGDIAAAAAALVIATEPTLLLFDRLLRMYAPLTALTALSCVLLLRASTAQTPRSRTIAWILYGVCALVMPYVMYLGAIVIASQCAYALFDLRRRWPALAWGAVSFVCTIPWWWGIKEQFPQSGYTGGKGLAAAAWSARDVLGYALPTTWYTGTHFDLIFAIVVVAISIAGLVLARGGAVAIYWCALAVMVIATFALGRNLVFARYLVYLVPAFAVAVGAIAAIVMKTRWRVAGVALVLAFLAINSVGDADQLVDKFYQSSDWNTVAAIMSQNERPGDVILFVQGYSYLVFEDSLSVAGHDVFGPQSPASIPQTYEWLDRHAGARVWYIENQAWYADPKHEIKDRISATRPRLREWFEPRSDPSSTVFFALYGPEAKCSMPAKGPQPSCARHTTSTSK